MAVAGGLLVAGGDRAPVLGSGEAAFADVAPAVDVGAERWGRTAEEPLTVRRSI